MRIASCHYFLSQLMNLAKHLVQRLKTQSELERSQFDTNQMPISSSAVMPRLVKVFQGSIRLSLVDKAQT
jgi:hypothetical protein